MELLRQTFFPRKAPRPTLSGGVPSFPELTFPELPYLLPDRPDLDKGPPPLVQTYFLPDALF